MLNAQINAQFIMYNAQLRDSREGVPFFIHRRRKLPKYKTDSSVRNFSLLIPNF